MPCSYYLIILTVLQNVTKIGKLSKLQEWQPHHSMVHRNGHYTFHWSTLTIFIGLKLYFVYFLLKSSELTLTIFCTQKLIPAVTSVSLSSGCHSKTSAGSLLVTHLSKDQVFKVSSAMHWTRETANEDFEKIGWLHGTVVECRSLTGELSPSCARPAADGWPLKCVNRPLYVSQTGQLRVDKWVVGCNQMSTTSVSGSAIWWTLTR